MEIVAIKIIDRIKEAGLTQGVLSKYASFITTRLGFHEVSDAVCSREACIILYLPEGNASLQEALKSIGGIVVKTLSFSGENVLTAAADVLAIKTVKKPEVTSKVQEILSSYGCNIPTRLGFSINTNTGLIILELIGDSKQRELLANDLKSIDGVEVRGVSF